MLIHFLTLLLAAHQRWPQYDIAKVARAVWYAVDEAGNDPAKAALFVAITEHESSFEPFTFSYKLPKASRVDVVLASPEIPAGYPAASFCGYMSSMAASHEACSAMLASDGGIAQGSRELTAWSETCRRNGHHELGCVLRGTAGGTACALRSECKPEHAAFARWFASVAEDLERRERQPAQHALRTEN